MVFRKALHIDIRLSSVSLFLFCELQIKVESEGQVLFDHEFTKLFKKLEGKFIFMFFNPQLEELKQFSTTSFVGCIKRDFQTASVCVPC